MIKFDMTTITIYPTTKQFLNQKFEANRNNNAIQDYPSNGNRLCEICNHPIPAERLEKYPEMTTCVPCQSLLEKPEKLRIEIARLNHDLLIKENQFSAVERLEIVSREKLDVWQIEIRNQCRLLDKLRVALYGEKLERRR